MFTPDFRQREMLLLSPYFRTAKEEARFLLRISALIWTCVIAILPLAEAQTNNNLGQSTLWCTINPGQPLQGRSVQISEDNIHIVSASKQADAKERLSKDTFIKIDRQEAAQLISSPAAAAAVGNYYLVRASAFYVDQNYNIKSHLEAYLFQDWKVLNIINYSLSQPGVRPVNLAVVVETDTEIHRAEATCLTAS